MRPTSSGSAHSLALLLALAGEIVVFSIIATNFLTVGNFFEITRLCVELGLVAVAMTPILVAGGIDLSVGAMMGLAAACFGVLARDLQMPIAVAVLGTLAVGAAGGALNALFVSWFSLPPLIVTL